ncbi:MAG: hypothetical protein ACRDS9_24465 [Pseudonocardiaceae bacterium]
MSTVYKVRHRVLRQRLQQIVATAKRTPHEEYMRLALLCLALLDRHTVNDKGRCRHCRTPREWWRRPSWQCTVLPLVSLHLEQPREFLNR